MKQLTLAFACFFAMFTALASSDTSELSKLARQDGKAKKKASSAKSKMEYIRIYDQKNKLVAQGYLFNNEDSSNIIVGAKGESAVTVPISKVSHITTGKPVGYHAFVGSLIGAALGAIIGSVSTPGDYQALATLVYGGGGMLVGAVGGVIVGGQNMPQRFAIDGDVATWLTVKNQLLKVEAGPAIVSTAD